MIIKWEIIPYPSEKYPDRYKVNIGCDYADLKKIMDFYGKRCGLPWKSKSAEFSFSFYIYKMSPRGVEEFENKIKELQSASVSVSPPAIIEEKKVPTSCRDAETSVQSLEIQDTSGKSEDGPGARVREKTDNLFFRPEPRSSVFPPRSSKKQPTNEEIKVAKEISAIIDFDVFEPEKLEAIEIKKENKEQEIGKEVTPVPVSAPVIQDEKSEEIKAVLPSEQNTISVGIIFRSGQEEFSKIIEDNLLKSVAGKKLKYKIKVIFAKGFLVFSQDDITDAITLCKEKNVSSVIIAGESKLAEVLHELLNSAGIFTEHINTTDVNKKSLYFNIATSIILSETGKKRE
ncbi:MAG: hypothetical protein Q7K21_04420 [Elusimicrobiota bacterium]|nr:hypothetical protein [Elusimicrobiota bacterium]